MSIPNIDFKSLDTLKLLRIQAAYPNSPASGHEKINELESRDIDGVLYEIRGACPEHSTPMEYGGTYFECDKDFLLKIPADKLKILYLEGNDCYIDLLSDLTYDYICYHTTKTNLTFEEIKKTFNCPIISDHNQADIKISGESHV